MSDPREEDTKSRFFDLETNRSRIDLARPASLLRTTEWGLLTAASLLAAFAFPPYFIQVLWLAFFNAGGLLWVTHLTEKGRQRLHDFEKEFSKGHQLEERGQWKKAVDYYSALLPKYSDSPLISQIASRRMDWLKAKHPSAFPQKPPQAPKRPKKKRKA